MDPCEIKMTINDIHAPKNNPNVKQKIMIAPASDASAGATMVAPYIIQFDATYPLVKANKIMNIIGKASLVNTTGSRELEMLHNRISGKKTILATDAIQIFSLVNNGFVLPATTRPVKSNKLNKVNMNGMNKSS